MKKQKITVNIVTLIQPLPHFCHAYMMRRAGYYLPPRATQGIKQGHIITHIITSFITDNTYKKERHNHIANRDCAYVIIRALTVTVTMT